MVKFEGSEAREIEICSWATRLPLFLNRPLIKVLEDRGVPPSLRLLGSSTDPPYRSLPILSSPSKMTHSGICAIPPRVPT